MIKLIHFHLSSTKVIIPFSPVKDDDWGNPFMRIPSGSGSDFPESNLCCSAWKHVGIKSFSSEKQLYHSVMLHIIA